MTTARPAQPPDYPAPFFRLPDIPEKHPDDMTSVQHLHEPGHTHHLSQYLGNPDTTLVTGERYVILGPDFDASDCRYPDLLVAFDVDPAAYLARNGYMIVEQGKPPDFILEVASRYSANSDRGVKKDYYERLRVGEYWLFDSVGEFYGFVLKGYRLVDGRYEEIEAQEVRPRVFEGYSAALNLILRVEDGVLGLYDPATGEHIPTFQSERARAESAEARADAAETRARELEAEIRRLRAGG
ncbi:MAG: Uma2 family endonuclease [Chloroflexota bacterium]|nr:Uma2 family endonuclease [Chloroflexota bacterium]MDE2959799.1 Uma2 family endonuclease [Chloroflexota bacterium]